MKIHYNFDSHKAVRAFVGQVRNRGMDFTIASGRYHKVVVTVHVKQPMIDELEEIYADTVSGDE